MLKRIKLLKAESLYINGFAYIEKFLSAAGWKTKTVTLAEFLKLKNKTAKLDAIKEQIKIRILGFGWDDLHISWSSNGIHKLRNCLRNQSQRRACVAS